MAASAAKLDQIPASKFPPTFLVPIYGGAPIPLAHVLPKYPRAAGCLFQAYNDILLVQQWSDVKVVDLEGVSRAAITGKKPKTEATLHVVPCSLAETLSFGWLKTAFTLLSDPPEIYLAITSDDASIVYYKISRGIVKPQL